MDLTPLDPVVDICREHNKPFAFVLNAVHPQPKLTKTVPGIIRRYVPLCDTMIADRKAYVAAMTVGKGPSQVERDEAAAGEHRRDE